MVGTYNPTGHTPDPAMVKAIRARLYAECDRYLHVCRTVQTLSTDGLAELVAEIVTEHTTPLRAELDAANDAVVELLHQRDEAELALGRALTSVEVA